jgi:hypothetical protein
MLFLKHLWRLLVETGQFAKRNKAWWMVPMILVLLLLALLVVAVITGAPFIYTFV